MSEFNASRHPDETEPPGDVLRASVLNSWKHWLIGAAIFAVGFVSGLDLGRSAGTPIAEPVEAPVVDSAQAWTLFVDRIAEEEGFSDTVYVDAGNTDAIGYGFNLTTGGFSREKRLRWIRDGITKEEGRDELENQLRARMIALAGAWPPYTAQTVPLRYALLDAAYELGVGGLVNFHETLADITLDDPEDAAIRIRASVWYHEAPNRAENLITVIQQEL